MDSKLKVIQNATNLNKEEASLALDLAEGDIEKALEMVDYVEMVFLVLQIKFQIKQSGGKVYGLISIIANGKQGDLLSLNIATAYNREVQETNIDISNEAFVQTIKQIRREQDSSYNLEIKKAFNNTLNSAKIFDLFANVKENELELVSNQLRQILGSVFESQVEVELNAEVITKAQAKQKTHLDLQIETEDIEEGATEEEQGEVAEEKEERDKLSIYLKCAPVISAIEGVKTENLEIGEEILVRIVDKREIGRYLADLICTEENQVARGVINDIYFNEDSGRYTVMLEFGPSIFGKVLAEGEVKLALAESLEVEENEEEPEEENLKIELDLPWLLLAVLLVLIVIVVFLLNTLI
ncbi:hypothetical protein [Fuchsiella alkaliacetigena]|uniref:hypothetical protein n=1 Tax=Fuchsiella alkaliacetigena TaxID=957042 RepID=UPI00200B7176|nr:hypothetical protein [Fuchsiella alkaliacetigena]MCK8823750.1 hypothetical protein [Fuchsiella alkaliacetigena]